MAKKTNRGPSLEHLLQEISEILVDSIPETVSRCKVNEPVYALLLAYQDYSTGDYTPQILLPPASVRTERLESQGDENGSCEIWMPMLLAQDVQEYPCEGPELAEKCEACYDLLSQNAPAGLDELDGLKPFREMLYRVALALDRQKWDKRLSVTDDFVVAVTDWNGFRSHEDVPASIPPKKRAALKQKRLLFYVDPADP